MWSTVQGPPIVFDSVTQITRNTLIPAYTLKPFLFYFVQFQTCFSVNNSQKLCNNATLSINVLSSGLRPIISGGSYATIGTKGKYSVDGSKSANLDFKDQNDGKVKVYQWSCVEQGTLAPCVVQTSQTTAENLDIPSESAFNITQSKDRYLKPGIYTITLVFFTSDARYSATSTSKTIEVVEGSPPQLVIDSLTKYRPSPSKALNIQANGRPSSVNNTLSYYWVVTEGAVSMESLGISSESIRTPRFTIPVGYLSQNTFYTFRVIGTENGTNTRGIAEVRFQTDLLPYGGGLDGPLQVNFMEENTFIAKGWKSTVENLPLSYSLGYRLKQDKYIQIISSYSLNPKRTAILPLGEMESPYTDYRRLELILFVKDNAGNQVTLSSFIDVKAAQFSSDDEKVAKVEDYVKKNMASLMNIGDYEAVSQYSLGCLGLLNQIATFSPNNPISRDIDTYSPNKKPNYDAKEFRKIIEKEGITSTFYRSNLSSFCNSPTQKSGTSLRQDIFGMLKSSNENQKFYSADDTDSNIKKFSFLFESDCLSYSLVTDGAAYFETLSSNAFATSVLPTTGNSAMDAFSYMYKYVAANYENSTIVNSSILTRASRCGKAIGRAGLIDSICGSAPYVSEPSSPKTTSDSDGIIPVAVSTSWICQDLSDFNVPISTTSSTYSVIRLARSEDSNQIDSNGMFINVVHQTPKPFTFIKPNISTSVVSLSAEYFTSNSVSARSTGLKIGQLFENIRINLTRTSPTNEDNARNKQMNKEKGGEARSPTHVTENQTYDIKTGYDAKSYQRVEPYCFSTVDPLTDAWDSMSCQRIEYDAQSVTCACRILRSSPTVSYGGIFEVIPITNSPTQSKTVSRTHSQTKGKPTTSRSASTLHTQGAHQNTANTAKSNSDLAILIGSAVGGIFGLSMIGFCIFTLLHRRKANRNAPEGGQSSLLDDHSSSSGDDSHSFILGISKKTKKKENMTGPNPLSKLNSNTKSGEVDGNQGENGTTHLCGIPEDTFAPNTQEQQPTSRHQLKSKGFISQLFFCGWTRFFKKDSSKINRVGLSNHENVASSDATVGSSINAATKSGDTEVVEASGSRPPKPKPMLRAPSISISDSSFGSTTKKHLSMDQESKHPNFIQESKPESFGILRGLNRLKALRTLLPSNRHSNPSSSPNSDQVVSNSNNHDSLEATRAKLATNPYKTRPKLGDSPAKTHAQPKVDLVVPSLPPLDLLPEEKPKLQESTQENSQLQQNDYPTTAEELPSPKSPARLEEQEALTGTPTTPPQNHAALNTSLHPARSVLAPRKFEPAKLSMLEHHTDVVDNTGNEKKNDDSNAKTVLVPVQPKGLPHHLASHKLRLPSLSRLPPAVPALHTQQLPPISDSPPAYASALKLSDPPALKPLNQPPPLPSSLGNSLNRTPLPSRPSSSLTPTRNQPLVSTPGVVPSALANESPNLPHSAHQTPSHTASHSTPQPTTQQSTSHSTPQTASRIAPRSTTQPHTTSHVPSHSASHIPPNESQRKQTPIKSIEDAVAPATPVAKKIRPTSALPPKPTTASPNTTSPQTTNSTTSKIDHHNIRPATPTNKGSHPSTPTNHSNSPAKMQSKTQADSAVKISTNPPQSHALRAPSNTVQSNARLANQMSVSALPMPMPRPNSSHPPTFKPKLTPLSRPTLVTSNPSHAALRAPAMLPHNSDHPPKS